MTLLGQHEPRFSARNSYADALLGVLCASEWLEAFVSGGAEAAARAPADADEARGREQMTLFLVGLVATGRAARRLIETWATSSPAAPVEPGRDARYDRRGWLR
jgi:hypothetical protein